MLIGGGGGGTVLDDVYLIYSIQYIFALTFCEPLLSLIQLYKLLKIQLYKLLKNMLSTS